MKLRTILATGICFLLAAGAGSAQEKPLLVAKYGAWGVYRAASTCYVLAQPNRRNAWIFVSTRPSEGVSRELAVSMGFAVRGPAKAVVNGREFFLAVRGDKLWLQQSQEAGPFVHAFENAEELQIIAQGTSGSTVTDVYQLNGARQAINHFDFNCREARAPVVAKPVPQTPIASPSSIESRPSERARELEACKKFPDLC